MAGQWLFHHFPIMLTTCDKTSLPIDKQLKNHVDNQQFLQNDVLLEGIRLSKFFPPPNTIVVRTR